MRKGRIAIIIWLLVCAVIRAQAQNENPAPQKGLGSITGKLISVDSIPLELVSISIKELNKNTLTDKNGNYNIEDIHPGTYTLRIQMLGARKIELKATVQADQVSVVNYQLSGENIVALQEVRVLSRVNKYSNKESNFISRLPLKNLENPQVYNTVPSALIQEQMAVDLGSVAKDVPGAGIPLIANQGRATFLSRGFTLEPNARNGVAGAAFSFIDNCNLERLEAIKGPSTTLFGTSVSSGYGGLFNRVTKKPFNGTGGQVAYTGGSWNYNRLALDYNTPLNTDKTALFRINGATTFEKSFQDNGYTNSVSLAPSFSYQVNDRLSLLLDVEFGRAKGTSVVRFDPYTGSKKVQSIKDIQYPYNKTFLGDDVYYTTQMMNIFGQINYKISGSWTSQTVFSRARSTIDGYITALNGRSDSTLRANVIIGNTNFIATDLQQNFIGDFKIFQLRNRMVVGLDYYNNYNNFDRVTVNGPTVNFIHTPSTYRVTRFTLDSLTSSGNPRKEKNSDNTYAAYVSDVLNITDRLLVMGSLRVDNYKYNGVYNIITGQTGGGIGVGGIIAGPYSQTSLSHKEGLVYEIVKNKLSVFGNYMSGFFNVSGSDKNGVSFKPEQGTQYEYGIKADVLQHRLVGTVSYYNINVKDVLRTDPDDANYSIQDGTQYSRGLEVDITANPVDGLNIIAGYALNKSKFTKADSSVLGLRPALSGPEKMFNFWVSYQFTHSDLKGLGVGFGGNTGSMSYQTNTIKAKTIIPSYAMFDATIFYDQPKFRISVKVDNLTSEKAWSSRLTPQPPARFLGSVALKF
ncbi:iron complex outermembrane recepter protein [Chitinophaga costaii]|uniref:Iron complex outermembrane recepter protein n=1 Tax=Chitinophaga costaii TaxID=1335309 RepID=A0A1C4FTN0_9BACT|nr:TonB-dependent receptor [Chitinophaga costaii]PUZ27208.1 TonB-dependent receptor [Chitinophaga costaii]SCC59369.1 iron complex outermembrane recepter protein [Chitinophaga costaii]